MGKVLILLFQFLTFLTFSQEAKQVENGIKFIVVRVSKEKFFELMEKELVLDKKQLEEIHKIIFKLEMDQKLVFNCMSGISKQNADEVQVKFKLQKNNLTALLSKVLTYHQLKKWHLESDNWK